MKVSLNNPVKCSDGAEIPLRGGLWSDLRTSRLFVPPSRNSYIHLSSHPLGKLAIKGLQEWKQPVFLEDWSQRGGWKWVGVSQPEGFLWHFQTGCHRWECRVTRFGTQLFIWPLRRLFPPSSSTSLDKHSQTFKGQLKRLMELKAPKKRNTGLINVMFSTSRTNKVSRVVWSCLLTCTCRTRDPRSNIAPLKKLVKSRKVSERSAVGLNVLWSISYWHQCFVLFVITLISVL